MGDKTCYERWEDVLRTIKGMCTKKTYIDEVGSAHGYAKHYMVRDLHIYLNRETGEILVSDKPAVLYNERFDGVPETYILYDKMDEIVTFGVKSNDNFEYRYPDDLQISYYTMGEVGKLKIPGIERKTTSNEDGTEKDILELLNEALQSKKIDPEEITMLKDARKFVGTILEIYIEKSKKNGKLYGLPPEQLLETLKTQIAEDDIRRLLIDAIAGEVQNRHKPEER